MNSLPPELVSSIIEAAAECGSTYSSYRLRLQTLSALSLVNRYVHQLARPFLPQKVYFRYKRELEDFLESGQAEQVTHFADLTENISKKVLDLTDFSNLSELRICCNLAGLSLAALDGHNRLKRLAFENVFLYLRPGFDNFTAPKLEELSLEEVSLIDRAELPAVPPAFLSASRFPALRALAIRNLRFYGPSLSPDDDSDSRIIDGSLLLQLSCLALDNRSLEALTGSSSPASSSIPVSFLFDLDLPTLTQFGAHPDNGLHHSHLRIRASLETSSPPHRMQLQTTIAIVQQVMRECTSLEELYVELPSDDRRRICLMAAIEEKMKELEIGQRGAQIKIIWENPEEDWCRSAVSHGYWKRCEEREEMP